MKWSDSAKSVTVPALVLGLLLSGTVQSHADILPELQSVTRSGKDYRWTYQVDLTSGERLRKGNYFTIYDFAGFVSGSNFQPANWVFSAAMVGKTPRNFSVRDNPALPNLTWTYAGKTKLGPGLMGLGLFGALSVYSSKQQGSFVGVGVRYAPHAHGNGRQMFTTGSVDVPTATIPEASTLSLLLASLLPLGLLHRRSTRR